MSEKLERAVAARATEVVEVLWGLLDLLEVYRLAEGPDEPQKVVLRGRRLLVAVREEVGWPGPRIDAPSKPKGERT